MTEVTLHAARRGQQRQVTAREIELTMRRPERVSPGARGRLLLERNGCVVVTDQTRRTIITVYRVP